MLRERKCMRVRKRAKAEMQKTSEYTARTTISLKQSELDEIQKLALANHRSVSSLLVSRTLYGQEGDSIKRSDTDFRFVFEGITLEDIVACSAQVLKSVSAEYRVTLVARLTDGKCLVKGNSDRIDLLFDFISSIRSKGGVVVEMDAK